MKNCHEEENVLYFSVELNRRKSTQWNAQVKNVFLFVRVQFSSRVVGKIYDSFNGKVCEENFTYQHKLWTLLISRWLLVPWCHNDHDQWRNVKSTIILLTKTSFSVKQFYKNELIDTFQHVMECIVPELRRWDERNEVTIQNPEFTLQHYTV